MAVLKKIIQKVSDMDFNEYSFYLWGKCSFRAFCHTCTNEFIMMHYNGGRIKERVKVIRHIPTGKMLRYAVLKDFYFHLVHQLVKNKELTYERCKKIGLASIEKSLAKYKKMAIRFLKELPDYENEKQKIYKDLENHLNLIKEIDFENSVMNCFREKISIKDYIPMRINELKPYYVKQLPYIEYGKNPGIISYDILNVSLNEFKELDVSIVSFFDFQPGQIRKNDFLCILIRWLKKYRKWPELEEKLKVAGDEQLFFNKLIIYNPLTITRKEVSYADIDGVFVEKFFLKKLNSINESCILPSFDLEQCRFCENARICIEESRVTKAYSLEMINNFQETLEREQKKFL
ncbi:hypothetical protein [Fusobacterium necrophorum]|uniref:hypothetical protein n=1 Tax=Fusobacterium necrophorum TaxID=859 RepID=UPI00254ACE00|nr:hypothetical protein [Fusobacterium necrophorum]MDK4523116.1 hypothetical protein [Fusobacterium necrophorum]